MIERRNAIRLGVVLASLFATGGVIWSRSAPSPVTFEDCGQGEVSEGIRCRYVEVPEVPGDRSSRTLRIKVVVLQALGAAPHREPLLVLQGGPGVAGTLMAPNFARFAPMLRESRDLVFFDQRGTTGSGSLTCAFLGRYDFLGALFPVDHVTACRRELSQHADLSAYTNTTSADDLEAVRISLGAETWSLLAYSFGTRLAQTYARKYPNRVHAVVLDGVVPFDADLTTDLATSMQRSLDYVVARCERDDECRTTYPDTRKALVRLVTRVDSAPVPVRLSDDQGRTLAGKFGHWEFAYALRGMLYGPMAASIPAWTHDAESTGDFTQFARVYWQRSRWVGDSTSLALHLGVYCSEDMPFSDSAGAVSRAQGTLMGARYYTEYRAGCASWPMPRASNDLRQPWKSDIPTLLFSGERDPVTPPEYGERVARSLTNARHIVIPGGGHAESSACKTQLIASFLAAPREKQDTSCVSELDFPRFVIER
jgi:pimeloyl-ACP methyl ester carboxylesterase